MLADADAAVGFTNPASVVGAQGGARARAGRSGQRRHRDADARAACSPNRCRRSPVGRSNRRKRRPSTWRRRAERRSPRSAGRTSSAPSTVQLRYGRRSANWGVARRRSSTGSHARCSTRARTGSTPGSPPTRPGACTACASATRPACTSAGTRGWRTCGRSRRSCQCRRRLKASPDRCFEDPTNAGFVQAPSLGHAVAAAVLRCGHLSHARTGQPDGPFAVDLSSDRVRLARWLLDGVRQGQPLGALLGYRFERGLHERQPAGARARPLHPPLPRARPTHRGPPRAGRADAWRGRGGGANNVVDGLTLLAQVRRARRKHRAALTGRPPATARRAGGDPR